MFGNDGERGAFQTIYKGRGSTVKFPEVSGKMLINLIRFLLVEDWFIYFI